MAPPSLNTRVDRPNNNALLVLFAALSALGLYTMRISPVLNDLPVGFLDVVETGVLPNSMSLKKDYTGIKLVDETLALLVGAFVYGPTIWNEPFYWQQIHFLSQITALIAIMNVEACRERNRGSWLKYTAVYSFLYQNIGGAVIVPIWMILFHRISGPKSYFQTGRAVPLPYARSILPGTIILYLIPTIALFVPGKSLATLQNLLAFWQFTPVLVNIPLWFAALSASSATGSKSKTADLPHLKILYAFLFTFCVGAHWYTIRGISTSTNPAVSFASVFVPSTYTWNKSMDWGVLYIFQWDWIVCGLMNILPAWIAVCDVLRLQKGGATLENWLEGFIMVMTLTIGGGPGAALAAVWFWREQKLATLEGGVKAKKAQ
ncbi:hypothetical protein BDW02DRAFT_518089 [Decorospora gaudefroyi]|uniref:Uncharacterized protein n=1 Tax=Decorospora gaudefroyi TaxID=184978 RepID=A0A6A5KHV2_9PLEO|nr:hypothetical protein BDW02DRAFT_518089 [Decorospora gaudefroyi]